MASHMDEPSTKKQRLDPEELLEGQPRSRDIKLDMTKYKDWVRVLADEELVSIFELGVKVRESVTFTVDVGQNFMKEAIKESESRITKSLEKHGEKLDSLSTALRNPQKKGARAERDVLKILTQNLGKSNFTFRDTHLEEGKGDIEADTPDGHSIMIEIKDWKNSLTKDAIESFEGNLVKVPHFKVGILLSMNSGITNRCKIGQFEVKFNDDQKQYMIYVPNAHDKDDLIVWSVLMASQLANIQVGELGEKKTQRLRKIYEEFQKNAQRSKDSRRNLEALKATVQQLEESVVPILESVDKVSKDLNKLLNK